jgi:hypothetical protein
MRCLRCDHVWQGHTTAKGRKREDAPRVKTYYYGCGGYVGKGSSCCQRAVIPKDLIEGWVLEQIGGIVHSYLDDGGEETLRRMIEQELAGASPPAGGFDGSALAAARQRKADIEATIENLLDNISPTNREYVDRRIEKLRAEMGDFEREEAGLLQQQDREQQALMIAQEAFAVARRFDRLVEVGTVDEKRTLVRAFLRLIDFDPESHSGTAHFWVVPNGARDGGDDDSASSFGMVAGSRLRKKRPAADGDRSSFGMVAGAAYKVFGAPERLLHHVFEGGHRWSGEKAIPWLKKWLEA